MADRHIVDRRAGGLGFRRLVENAKGVGTPTHPAVILLEFRVAGDNGFARGAEGRDRLHGLGLGGRAGDRRHRKLGAGTDHRLHEGRGLDDGGIQRSLGRMKFADNAGDDLILVHEKPLEKITGERNLNMKRGCSVAVC